MSSFKLEYLPCRYLGEPARLILAYSGHKFDDVRISPDEWKKIKSSKFYQTLPVLTVDGKEIEQSTAIWHYLARKFNLAGKDEIEEAQMNAVGEFFRDMMNSGLPYVLYLVWGGRPGREEIMRQSHLLPALNSSLPKIVELLKKSKSGFFADSGLTWVDFLVADYMTSAFKAAPEIEEKFPELKEHIKRVMGLPQLQEYLENRPETDW
ncbi:hypothetical protein FO519_008301 [Halicephalobus sp. NKZ332]|nr:hypothetical protein FO519_008301 [Halicephalobus sp. NKZ332]